MVLISTWGFFFGKCKVLEWMVQTNIQFSTASKQMKVEVEQLIRVTIHG